jgi:hypothetical protein
MLTNVHVNAACNILCSEMSVTNSSKNSSFKEMKCSHNIPMALWKVCERGGMGYQQYPVMKTIKKIQEPFLTLCCYTVTNCFNSSD